LLRITNMRGVDINVFDFDYDLTWAALFMNGHETILGRYGGRDEKSPTDYLTLAGLKHSLRAALLEHRRDPTWKSRPGDTPPRTVEQYPAAKGLKADACIHCHQVYDFRREQRQAAGTWQIDDIWVYPLPATLGMVLDAERGDRLKSVTAGSPAERAGLRAGDELTEVNGQAVASFTDVQYALHRARGVAAVRVAWRRDHKTRQASLELPTGWRKSDLSWRASMWSLEPSPCVQGNDLTAREKRDLGLPEQGMAFRQGDFVADPAKAAGVQAGDVIFGIDGKKLDLTMLQFNMYVRLKFKPGDRITFNLLRDGKRLDLPMTLPKGQY
jgi:serine protease Do